MKAQGTGIGIILFLLLAWLAAASPTARMGGQAELILATTTSTQDSGLLDVLVTSFEAKTGIFVKTIAVGSGQAMALGRRGEADVLLVHSPGEELTFMEQGFGLRRRAVMYNDFILVGPPRDPAHVKEAASVKQALSSIASHAHAFLSRGDGSGTHVKEMCLWSQAGVNPQGAKWYQETGQGMGQTLMVASEKEAYTLSDRGTFLALGSRLSLEILFQGDSNLKNEYHVIEINPAKFPRVNATSARLFSDFLVSKEAQDLIRTFGLARYGQPLFFVMGGPDQMPR